MFLVAVTVMVLVAGVGGVVIGLRRRAVRRRSGHPELQYPLARGSARRRVRPTQANLVGSVDAQMEEITRTLTECLVQAQLDFASLEQRHRRDVMRLTRLLERQRSDFEKALDSREPPDVAAFARVIDKLAGVVKGHEYLLVAVRSFRQATPAPLAAGNPVEGGLIHALEEQLHQAESRLAHLSEPANRSDYRRVAPDLDDPGKVVEGSA